MTKRSRSEYDLNAWTNVQEKEAALVQTVDNHVPAIKGNWEPEGEVHRLGGVPREGIAVAPTVGASVPVPVSNSTPEGEAHRSEANQADDVADRGELPNHPFWALLLRAGYTIW